MAISEPGHTRGAIDLVSWVFGNQDYDQNRPIYIDVEQSDRTISATEARSIVKKLIAGLKANGTTKGDCICLHAFNDVLYPMFVLAVIGAGGVFTGTNPAYTQTELSRHLRETKARFLISDPNLLSKMGPAVVECGLSPSKIFILDGEDHTVLSQYRSWKELLNFGKADWVTFTEPDQAHDTTAALMSTSGTSGLPKAAMISHASMITQTVMLDDMKQKPYQVSRLIALPVFHAFAFPITHTLPLRDGTPTYIMRRFELPKFLFKVNSLCITETAIVPSIITTILKCSFQGYKLLRSLQTVWCAGSPLAQIMQNEFFRLLRPTARLLQVWGMTEAGWITTFLWPEKDHSGSVGRLLPGMEAKLMQEGEIVEKDNAHAEIFVRGPTVMQGYLRNSEATREMIDEDGWLRTGDRGYREQGKYYISGRMKEMIKTRGWQISPAELEAQLILHPTITDAAVIGVLSPNGDTEYPRAYVVKALDADFSEAEIKRYMSVHLAKYKALEGGVKVIDQIPKNSTGKILRSELKEFAAVEDSKKQSLTITVTSAVNDRHGASAPRSATSFLSTGSESDVNGRNVTGGLYSPATDFSASSDADDEAEVEDSSALVSGYAKMVLNDGVATKVLSQH